MVTINSNVKNKVVLQYANFTHAIMLTHRYILKSANRCEHETVL